MSTVWRFEGSSGWGEKQDFLSDIIFFFFFFWLFPSGLVTVDDVLPQTHSITCLLLYKLLYLHVVFHDISITYCTSSEVFSSPLARQLHLQHHLSNLSDVYPWQMSKPSQPVTLSSTAPPSVTVSCFSDLSSWAAQFCLTPCFWKEADSLCSPSIPL